MSIKIYILTLLYMPKMETLLCLECLFYLLSAFACCVYFKIISTMDVKK